MNRREFLRAAGLAAGAGLALGDVLPSKAYANPASTCKCGKGIDSDGDGDCAMCATKGYSPAGSTQNQGKPDAREWDLEWKAPDGRILNLHRIDMVLGFNTPFMFDMPSHNGGTRRRAILNPFVEDPNCPEGVSFSEDNEPGMPAGLFEFHTGMNMGNSIQQRVLHAWNRNQEGGFDVFPPEDCVHGLYITAKMPHRHTGTVTFVHAYDWLPCPIKLADLIMMVPATHALTW